MKALAVLGPTASGKSDVAVALAQRYAGEVVSVDSMQVYRGMDIGTAKATSVMRERVHHHLIDICDPGHDMSVAEFQRTGRDVISDLQERELAPIVCGGSGLHFRSLVDPLEFPPSDPTIRADLETLRPEEARSRLVQLDPTAGDHVDLANPRRVVRALEIAAVVGSTPSQRAATAEAAAVRDYRPLLEFAAVGFDPGDELAERVESRFDVMLDAGLLDEVAGLRGRLGRLSSQAVGYKELLAVVSGEITLATGRAAAVRATRALAKRQRTYFRRDPRIHWLPWRPTPAQRAELAADYLDGQL